MDSKERAYRTLVVSVSESFNTSLKAILNEWNLSPVRFVGSISAAKREVLEQRYDLIIVNSPLPDDAGVRFSIDESGTNPSVVLLAVRAEQYGAMFEKVSEHGVYLLSKPSSRGMVTSVMDWMVTTRERLKKMETKTTTLEEKMQEIRTVNRAKWVLIERLNMTESDAHRYIEKQAMDRCVPKREIAEEIIRTYS